MSLTKEITFSDGSTVRMRASAIVPRLYRVHFGRDILRDLTKLQGSVNAVKTGTQENLDINDLTIFEDLSWIMARHAAQTDGVKDFPGSPDEWLESLDHVLDIYEAMPQIMELWTANTATTSTPAKK